jgi:hypothetical protein
MTTRAMTIIRAACAKCVTDGVAISADPWLHGGSAVWTYVAYLGQVGPLVAHLLGQSQLPYIGLEDRVKQSLGVDDGWIADFLNGWLWWATECGSGQSLSFTGARKAAHGLRRELEV